MIQHNTTQSVSECESKEYYISVTDHDRHSLRDTGVHVCTLEEGGWGRGREWGGGGTQSDMLHEI